MKIGTVASLVAGGLLLTGCATGMPGSARRICNDAGLQPGTSEFSRCWKGVRNEQFAREWDMIGAPLTAVAIVGVTAAAAKNAGEANALVHSRASEVGTSMPAMPQPYRSPAYVPRLNLGSSSHSRPADRTGTTQLCPDARYVVGNCTLAPDGTFVGGRPQMAPDGSFLTAPPRMTPNGRFVGGKGPTTMCPDGSFVSGSRCQLMPNGQYVGEQ